MDADRLADAERVLAHVTGAKAAVDAGIRSVVAAAPNGVDTLVQVANALSAAGIAVEDLSIRHPTLDEVFIALTDSPAYDEPVVASGEGARS